MAKFRVRCAKCKENFCTNCKMSPYHINYSCEEAANKKVAQKCRFCLEILEEPSLSYDPAFQDVCRRDECVEHMRNSCNKTHECGHKCKGYHKERQCLPCLEPDCIETYNQICHPSKKLYDGFTADDLCGLCYISGLGDQPSIMLGCRHIFHVGCIIKRIKIRWTTPWIQFSFMDCPTCKQEITVPPDHAVLNQELNFLKGEKKKIMSMAL